ncbi:carboxypeptidase-like regulatory domain-containing protein [Allorhizocola rhizosphaerae]|uniref:carboxypeptidase-like regulatory domain-containing protein n=1 Tax=Allorhizocola rhizosphaerae TaxID=1872709 RepID=UPI000E3E1C12|nr:carboxypeptidase-like regulatory domain-containing protein [Allorhizocola rhizosphaerae]
MREPNPTGALVRAAENLLSRLTAAGVPARLQRPSDADTGGFVGAWPVSLLPEALPGKGGGGPLRLRLRFLVYAAGGGEWSGLDLLDRIFHEEPLYLVPEGVPDSLWRAIGAKLRPALFFDVPVHVSWPEESAPRVTSLPRIVAATLRDVSGTVVAPGGVPLVGMRVAVADGTATTHTDGQGRFTLPGVLSGQPVRLVVTGRGLHFHADVDFADGEPVVITCQI